MKEIKLSVNGGLLIMRGPNDALMKWVNDGPKMSAEPDQVWCIVLPEDVDWAYIDKDGHYHGPRPLSLDREKLIEEFALSMVFGERKDAS